jgi:hypothetical protein
MSAEETKRRYPSRREFIIGWILSFAFLAIYIACPNVKMPNGDVYGWTRQLQEYATADGNLFFVTEPKQVYHRRGYMTPEEWARLGARERDAGWWVLWHPHHLLYSPVFAVLYRVTYHFLPNLDSWEFLRIWNALASAGIILLLYRLLIRIAPGSPYPLPWLIFLGTSVTFFRYATDGSQYMVPSFFMAVASGGIWAFVSDKNPKYLVRAGFWLALSGLFHQLAALCSLFILVALFFLVWGRKKSGDGNYWIWFWWMAAITIGLPVAVYLIVEALALGPTGEFNLAGIIKYTTLLAGQKEYWNHSFWDGFRVNLITFMGFYFFNPRTQWIIFSDIWFTAMASILVSFWITGILNIKKLKPNVKWWLIFSLIWVLPLLVFLSFWTPGNEFYHFFIVIPLSCLAVIGAESGRRPGKRGLIDSVVFYIWIVIAMIINLPLSIQGSPWVK